MNILKKIKSFLAGNTAVHEALVTRILELHQSFAELSAIELQAMVAAMRGAPTADNIVKMYALVMEAFKRQLHITPYHVQLLAAVSLNERNILEMQTGEGKTFVAAFYACLQALSGKGVHVLTFNEYLAQRDANWLKDVYAFLGFTVKAVAANMDIAAKQDAYRADITYATAKQVGFDYLHSSMAYTPDAIIIHDFHCAIIDEADAILIDEARNPLVLAGHLPQDEPDYPAVAAFIKTLQKDTDYELDDYQRHVFLTDSGLAKAEKHFEKTSLHEVETIPLLTAINQGLQAAVLLIRDVDYVVEEGIVKLVDEFTGRIVEDRKLQSGLQAAVEAKEGVPVARSGIVLNSISMQHVIAQYKILSGMTGSAKEASQELHDFYNLGVIVIPPNKPSQRQDLPDLVFPGRAEKIAAIVKEVKRVHAQNRPVLVGTRSVKESEELQQVLHAHGIACAVLNAKNDELEAAIIGQAGEPGKVTISTNMAGRGTDIRLHQPVKGGLHVIGTNRHESVRIDNQLRGRAGRQGDPGSTQFIISQEDDLMIKYDLKSLLPMDIHKAVAQLQRIIEGQLSDQRKTLFNYSNFIEIHRKVFFTERNKDFGDEARLLHFDLLWADYLSEVAEIREGIHLERLAGKSPLQEFRKRADELFRTVLERLNDVSEEVLLEKRKPGATWTYIVNDNPFRNQVAIRLIQLSNFKF